MFISMYKAACVHGNDQGWRDTSISFFEGTEDRYCTEKKGKKLSLGVLCRLPI